MLLAVLQNEPGVLILIAIGGLFIWITRKYLKRKSIVRRFFGWIKKRRVSKTSDSVMKTRVRELERENQRLKNGVSSQNPSIDNELDDLIKQRFH